MIRLIVALDKERGIAKNGDQPWNLPADKAYFMEQTQKYGGIVLMGHRAYQVIGHALKNRRNIVVSRHVGLIIPGVEVVHDLEAFAKNARHDIWIIGGSSVFEQALPYADELYITRIDAVFDCDQFFPKFEDTFVFKQKNKDIRQNKLTFRYEIWTC